MHVCPLDEQFAHGRWRSHLDLESKTQITSAAELFTADKDRNGLFQELLGEWEQGEQLAINQVMYEYMRFQSCFRVAQVVFSHFYRHLLWLDMLKEHESVLTCGGDSDCMRAGVYPAGDWRWDAGVKAQHQLPLRPAAAR